MPSKCFPTLGKISHISNLCAGRYLSLFLEEESLNYHIWSLIKRIRKCLKMGRKVIDLNLRKKYLWNIFSFWMNYYRKLWDLWKEKVMKPNKVLPKHSVHTHTLDCLCSDSTFYKHWKLKKIPSYLSGEAYRQICMKIQFPILIPKISTTNSSIGKKISFSPSTHNKDTIHSPTPSKNYCCNKDGNYDWLNANQLSINFYKTWSNK